MESPLASRQKTVVTGDHASLVHIPAGLDRLGQLGPGIDHGGQVGVSRLSIDTRPLVRKTAVECQ